MLKKRNENVSSSKLLFMILSAVLAVLLWNFIAISLQMIDSQTKISNLHKDLEELQAKQNALKNMDTFFQSDAFSEREARLKYGYQKNGEHMVIIQEPGNMPVRRDERGVSKELSVNADPSVRFLWWRYFFGTD